MKIYNQNEHMSIMIHRLVEEMRGVHRLVKDVLNKVGFMVRLESTWLSLYAVYLFSLMYCVFKRIVR